MILVVTHDVQQTGLIALADRIELWPIEELRPYERNPRTHSEAQVDQIAASMVEFGWTNPVLVDEQGGILAGHGRLLAAQKLGLAEVPVIRFEHLSEVQKRAYLLADNQLALQAGWDEPALAEIVGWLMNQLQTYKVEIPSLFRTNALLVISDGMQARIGSLTADIERFMPWRTTDGHDVAPKGAPELPVLLEGVFERRRLLELIRGYTVFAERDGELIKIIAGYHQFHAVRHAIERTLAAAAPEGDRRIGVIWHTQGSGKSLLMAFYAGRIIVEPSMVNGSQEPLV